MTARKKNSNSLFRRLIYFVVMLVTGGGAGVGGWAFKDHPRMQALIGMVMGKAEEPGADGSDLKSKLTSAVAGVLQDDPRQPGLYKVKITEIQLDPKLFKTGHTVDIQARVLKIDGQGSETRRLGEQDLRREPRSRGQGRADRRICQPPLRDRLVPRR